MYFIHFLYQVAGLVIQFSLPAVWYYVQGNETN